MVRLVRNKVCRSQRVIPFLFFSSTEFHNSSRYRPFFTEVFHRALSTLRCTSSYFNFDESLVRVTCLGIGRPNITRLAKDLKASLSMNFLQNETNAPRSSLRRTGYEFLSNVETNSPRSARRFSDFLSPLQLGLRWIWQRMCTSYSLLRHGKILLIPLPLNVIR